MRRLNRSLLAWWTMLHVASIGLFLPWLAYFRQHAITFSTRAAPRLTVGQFIEGSWSELVLGIDSNVARLRPLNVVLAAVVVGLLAWLTVRKWPGWTIAWWLALIVVALPATAYVITLPTGLFFGPTYETRYQLMAVPALTILIGWGISSLPRQLRLLPALGFAAVGFYTLTQLYSARHLVDDYQTLSRFVQAYERPGDLIVFDPDSAFDLFLFPYRGRLPWAGLPVNQHPDAAATDGYFSKWMRTSQSIWLVQIAGGHDVAGGQPVRHWLESHLRATLQRAVGNKLVTLYQPTNAPLRSLDSGFAPQQSISSTPGVTGFDLPIRDVRPGEVLNVSAYGPKTANAKLRLGDSISAGQSLPNQVAFSFPINPSIRSARQALTLVLANGAHLSLASIDVASHRMPSFKPQPPLAHAVNRDFGGKAVLTSYQLGPGNPKPGSNLAVTLQWRAEHPFARDYTVFVHLLDAANHVVAQRDAEPGGGRDPTVQWVPGQTIDDPYELSLPATLKPGAYVLEVGMYLQATGERLKLADGAGADHLLLGQVVVR